MEENTPVLHQYPISPFAAKVRRVFHHQGRAFRTRNYRLTELRAVRRISPSGKLPALETDGRLIVDSTEIVHHLDRPGTDSLFPEDPHLRAMVHVLEDWADASLYFYDLTMRTWPHNVPLLADDLTIEDRGWARAFFHRIIPGAIRRQATAQGLGRKSPAEICREVERHFDALEAFLSAEDFLVGGRLTMADIAVVSMCTVLDRAREASEAMARRPRLSAWRARMDERTLPADTPPDQRALA